MRRLLFPLLGLCLSASAARGTQLSFSDRTREVFWNLGPEGGPAVVFVPNWWSVGDVVATSPNQSVESLAKTRLLKFLLKPGGDFGSVWWIDVRMKSLVYVFAPGNHKNDALYALCVDVPSGDRGLIEYRANDKCITLEEGASWPVPAQKAAMYKCCFGPLKKHQPIYIYAVPNSTRIDWRFQEVRDELAARRAKLKSPPLIRWGREIMKLDDESYKYRHGSFGPYGDLSTSINYQIFDISLPPANHTLKSTSENYYFSRMNVSNIPYLTMTGTSVFPVAELDGLYGIFE